jgi:hypothetical protein
MKHLMTYESFSSNLTNEEFDWKKTKSAIRRGVGILTPEETIEKGKKYVMDHPVRKRKYEEYLQQNPKVAEEYLKFWAEVEGERNAVPVWDEKKHKFIDKAIYTSSPGSIGSKF